MEKLNDKIKILREKLGLTQSEIAKCLGIDRSTYTYYENGRTIPPWHTLRKIAQVFRVSYSDLLEDENKSIVSDVLISQNDSKGLNICDLTKRERKIILSLRAVSCENQKFVVESIEKIIDNFKDSKNRDK